MAASELDPGASPLALFGAELRRLRDERGVTQEEIADYAHVSKSLVSQIENAKRTPQRDFTEQVESLLGLKGDLLRLLPLVIKSGPTWFRQWPKIEADAHTLRTWQPLVVPGLLQTRNYARAILSGQPGISNERVDEEAEARLARQVVFDRPEPPMYAAVIDEGVLLRPIGGAEVMRQQLDHLLKLLAHPCITLQIVPMGGPSRRPRSLWRSGRSTEASGRCRYRSECVMNWAKSSPMRRSQAPSARRAGRAGRRDAWR
ncbi:helix-turn-helix domain-containing protein [Nonomuraea jabiensis]|uniref:Transcriptional regulator with XRE-family HTH domain n=1 Tax=Nonomuraea jabiensis TaxID=882448 RepID=A0A7W9FY71_9ACTN|nr:transcriptional regulator with XRE-family HTH domain [Nonomuraea jabiensis]